MRIICPTLNRDEPASESAIADIVPMLEKGADPFLILEKNEMTYMQILRLESGYQIEYQEGSILEHYQLAEPTTKDNVIWALQAYLRDEWYWKTKFRFERKEIATTSLKLGHRLGCLVGRVFRFVMRNRNES